MVTWTSLIHLGDLRIIVPAATAIAVALAARGAWRLAWRWCVLFSLSMLAVAASKVYYMSTGNGLPAIDFKALSGHATGATAVLPILLYLGARHWRELRRPPDLTPVPAAALPPTGLRPDFSADSSYPGVISGLALGAVVTAMLVLAGEHTLAEALAGYLLGAAVSLSTLRVAGALPPPPPLSSLMWVVLATLATLWMMRWAHVGYWMIKAARLLTGNRTLHTLTID
jgi:hypothetical protein